MTKTNPDINLLLPNNYYTFITTGAKRQHENFYCPIMSGKYIKAFSIQGFCPLYPKRNREFLQVPVDKGMKVDYCGIYNKEFLAQFAISDWDHALQGDYLPIAYTNEFEPICLGITKENFGQVFLYAFDDIELLATSYIGDPEDGNLNVEEYETYSFHRLADNFTDFITNLVSDRVIQYVPEMFRDDMMRFFGDDSELSVTERLLHYHSAAGQLAAARQNVTFSYLAKLKKPE